MTIPELYKIFQEHPSVQTDTRKLNPGDIFFALKGPSFNGNAFAKKAIDSGAAYAVIDEAAYALDEKTILVDDALDTLQQLALHHRRQFDIPFIAITGSNGKTTTKELIHAVLSTTYKTYTTEGNFNNHIGVPLTLLRIQEDAEMAVIEMGANHLEEIASYCRIALPTHGLITNCGKAHLEGFGSEAGVRKGKGELYDHLRAHKGTAFLMKDYDYLAEMSRGIPSLFSYGTAGADVTGNVVSSDPYLEVRFSNGMANTISTRLVGSYNLPNVLAAVATGIHFKVDPDRIKKAIESYTPTNSRSQLLEKGSNKIILDAYNANPSSMKAAIENFSMHAADQKILVLGAMAELGADSVEEHRKIVEEISRHQWKEVLLVGGDFLKTSHGFRSFDNPSSAGEWLHSQGLQEAYLLVKGSRSMQMEKILDYL